MPLPERQNNTVKIEEARIVFRNFAGKEGQYNREGDRNFSIVLPPEIADQMEADGWNVKRKPPREEGDDEFIHLPVTVGFKGRSKPRIVMITSRGRTGLDEETCELVDWADIQYVDVIVRPYDWAVNGKTGRKAYLKTIFVIINEDELELKYSDVPEIGEQPALPAGDDPNIIDAEVVDEWDDEDRKALPRGKN